MFLLKNMHGEIKVCLKNFGLVIENYFRVPIFYNLNPLELEVYWSTIWIIIKKLKIDEESNYEQFNLRCNCKATHFNADHRLVPHDYVPIF